MVGSREEGQVVEGGEIKFRNDFGTKEARQVGPPRKLETGDEFLGDCCTANKMARFKNQNTLEFLCKICCSREPVVPPPNDDSIEFHKEFWVTSWNEGDCWASGRK